MLLSPNSPTIHKEQAELFAEIIDPFHAIDKTNPDPIYWQKMIGKHFPFIKENNLYHDNPREMFKQTSQYFEKLLNRLGAEYSKFVEQFEKEYKCTPLSTNQLAHIIKELLRKAPTSAMAGTTKAIGLEKLMEDLHSKLSDLDLNVAFYLDVEPELNKIVSPLISKAISYQSLQKYFLEKDLKVIKNFKPSFEAFMRNFESSYPLVIDLEIEYLEYLESKESHALSTWSQQAKILPKWKKERQYLINKLINEFTLSAKKLPEYVKSNISFDKLIEVDNFDDVKLFNKLTQDIQQQMELSKASILKKVEVYQSMEKELQNAQLQLSKKNKIVDTEKKKLDQFNKDYPFKDLSKNQKDMKENLRKSYDDAKEEHDQISSEINSIKMTQAKRKEEFPALENISDIEVNINKYHDRIHNELIPVLVAGLSSLEQKLQLNDLMLYSPDGLSGSIKKVDTFGEDIVVEIDALLAQCDALREWHANLLLEAILNQNLRKYEMTIHENDARLDAIYEDAEKVKEEIFMKKSTLSAIQKDKDLSKSCQSVKSVEMALASFQKTVDSIKKDIEQLLKDKNDIDIERENGLNGLKKYEISNNSDTAKTIFLVNYDVVDENMKRSIHNAMDRNSFARAKGDPGVKYEKPTGAMPYYKLKFPRGSIYGGCRIKFKEIEKGEYTKGGEHTKDEYVKGKETSYILDMSSSRNKRSKKNN